MMKCHAEPARYVASLMPSPSRKLIIRELKKTALVAINKMPGASAARVEEQQENVVRVSFDWAGRSSPVLPREYLRNFHLVAVDSAPYAPADH
ncbi:MAG: hypothetical protein ACREP7_03000 [Lysobacter sp.]